MSLSIKFGNFLFKNAFALYKPFYSVFKNKQDAFEIQILKEHIQPGFTVLDIGANIGFYAKLLSELTGKSGAVHCFEPDTVNFSHLKKSVGQINNITLNHLAVNATTEIIKIYTSKELNVDHRTYQPEDFDQEIEIAAISIDDYVSRNKISKIDFIKMDIQGFEMQAIKGMSNTLASNPKIQLISEFWPYGLNKAGSSAMEYFNYLRSKNFICYLLEKNNLKQLDTDMVVKMEHLGKEHYFNILALPHHV